MDSLVMANHSVVKRNQQMNKQNEKKREKETEKDAMKV